MNADKRQDEFSSAAYPHKDLTEKIIGAAFNVSNPLGCGFLEKVYENALVIELKRLELDVQSQVPLRVQYRQQTVGDYVADIIVAHTVLVEAKATPVVEFRTAAPEIQEVRLDA